MQKFEIDRSPRKNLLVIEEMKFLTIGQYNLRMPAQKIMERARARFLRAGNNEIKPLDFVTFRSEHVILSLRG